MHERTSYPQGNLSCTRKGQASGFPNKTSASSSGAVHAHQGGVHPGLLPLHELARHACLYSAPRAVYQSFFFFHLVLKHRIYWIIRVRREAALVSLFWYKEQWLARSHFWSVSVIFFCLPLGVTFSVSFGSRSKMALGKKSVCCFLLLVKHQEMQGSHVVWLCLCSPWDLCWSTWTCISHCQRNLSLVSRENAQSKVFGCKYTLWDDGNV